MMKPDAIIILGMHRSGTSCLTGCLKSYGLELGSVSEFNKNNLKGNQENRAVFRLNEAILNHNGGSWSSPPEQALSWTAEHLASQRELLDEYQQLAKPWGIKDPRMLMVFDFWKPQLPANHAVVGTFRNPMAVAQSLAARKKLSVPIADGLQLWNQYNLKLLQYHQQQAFPVINFDLPENQYLNLVEKTAHSMGLEKNPDSPFFDATLKNQKNQQLADCPAAINDTYQQLLSISLKP